MVLDDVEVVSVCCKDIADELDLPSDTMVVADFIDPHLVYIVSKEDFMSFLEENSVVMGEESIVMSDPFILEVRISGTKKWHTCKESYTNYIQSVSLGRRVVFPVVVAQLMDLEEYVRDFCKETDTHLSAIVSTLDGGSLDIFMHRNNGLRNPVEDPDAAYPYSSMAFHMIFSFEELLGVTIPDLGNCIFDMWNAYHNCCDVTEA